MQEIYNTAYKQLKTLNWQAGLPFKFQDAMYSEESNYLQVTVKKTSSYIYKFFIRYDAGWDTYSTRFGKMYIGKQSSREDWLIFMITEWSRDIYADGLLQSLMIDYRNRDTLDYHDIQEEWKPKRIMIPVEIERDNNLQEIIAERDDTIDVLNRKLATMTALAEIRKPEEETDIHGQFKKLIDEQAKNIYQAKFTHDDNLRERQAQSVAYLTSHFFRWSIMDMYQVCAFMLEDINNHKEAERFFNILDEETE